MGVRTVRDERLVRRRVPHGRGVRGAAVSIGARSQARNQPRGVYRERRTAPSQRAAPPCRRATQGVAAGQRACGE